MGKKMWISCSNHEVARNGAERGGILAACETLHRIHGATRESTGDEVAVWEESRRRLKKRLLHWCPPSSQYDDIVKSLIECALALEPCWARTECLINTDLDARACIEQERLDENS